jgi:XTP/dITP diphosphohydrolase
VRLVIATTNPNKLAEIRSVLGAGVADLVSLHALPFVDEPDETGATFAENARLKALYYARLTDDVVLAEDSGLEIEALGGWPGVGTARVAGATYPEKWAEVYRRVDALGSRTSSARFVSAIALARGPEILFEAIGQVEGRVAPEPRGSGGFGYDPIFYYPPFGATLAEVPAARKSEVSHRARAIRQLRAFLEAGG